MLKDLPQLPATSSCSSRHCAYAVCHTINYVNSYHWATPPTLGGTTFGAHRISIDFFYPISLPITLLMLCHCIWAALAYWIVKCHCSPLSCAHCSISSVYTYMVDAIQKNRIFPNSFESQSAELSGLNSSRLSIYIFLLISCIHGMSGMREFFQFLVNLGMYIYIASISWTICKSFQLIKIHKWYLHS